MPFLFRKSSKLKPAAPDGWDGWNHLFSVDAGMFDRPLILFMDELDSLPSKIIDRLVTLFRDMYLNRERFLLHGLALIGAHAVLGVESDRGIPFNVQRSLRIPNFTEEEVQDLFRQYQEESGQGIEAEVVDKVYEVTRGQPGLVCWFGELLTETYNPGQDQTIDLDNWKEVYRRACFTEWNNTVLNLVEKAKNPYCPHILDLFTSSALPFTLNVDWCSYLYLNGIIDLETTAGEYGAKTEVCRFSCPFIQLRNYKALIDELIGDCTPIPALDPLDELTDVFEGATLDMPALLQWYKDYLGRLKAKGITPWKDQSWQADLHVTEAVGHFHLVHWLQNAVGDISVISPEFPTGNGKVDLHLQYGAKRGLIEVKRFVNAAQVKESRGQAARYAGDAGLSKVTVALFVPIEDEEVLEKLSGEETVDGVTVTVVAIGWVG